MAIGVNSDGFREIIGAAESMKEDKESWSSFLVWLKGRGLSGVRLIIGDRNLGMLDTIPEVFPDACYQRCTVHFYQNIFSVTPRNKMKTVAMMLKAIHGQESKEVSRKKARRVSDQGDETGQFGPKGAGRDRGDADLYGLSTPALDEDQDQEYD